MGNYVCSVHTIIEWKLHDVSRVKYDCELLYRCNQDAIKRYKSLRFDTQSDIIRNERRIAMYENHANVIYAEIMEWDSLILKLEVARATVTKAEEFQELEDLFAMIADKYKHAHSAKMLARLEQVKDISDNLATDEVMSLAPLDKDLLSAYHARTMPIAPDTVIQPREKRVFESLH